VAIALETVRLEWEEAHRRIDAERDPTLRERVYAQVEVVTAELRKRVGQTFSLDDLADAYQGADRWALDALEERAPFPGWPRTAALATEAAFHLYQRGAVDYSP
jgi:hypothetical protein